jgi:hypothetical protein
MGPDYVLTTCGAGGVGFVLPQSFNSFSKNFPTYVLPGGMLSIVGTQLHTMAIAGWIIPALFFT